MTNATLDGAEMRVANLDGALLINTNLAGANLDSAILTHSMLAGANLNGAVLTGADLSGAIFTTILEINDIDYLVSASFGGTSMARANLTDAYIAGVHIDGANIKWADLSGATMVDEITLNGEAIVIYADITGVKTNEKTIWPESFGSEIN